MSKYSLKKSIGVVGTLVFGGVAMGVNCSNPCAGGYQSYPCAWRTNCSVSWTIPYGGCNCHMDCTPGDMFISPPEGFAGANWTFDSWWTFGSCTTYCCGEMQGSCTTTAAAFVWAGDCAIPN